VSGHSGGTMRWPMLCRPPGLFKSLPVVRGAYLDACYSCLKQMLAVAQGGCCVSLHSLMSGEMMPIAIILCSSTIS